MSTSHRRTTAAVLALTIAPLAVALSPAGGAAAEYNIGVKSLTIRGVADSCEPGYALPCTPAAGTGDANVLRVTQSIVDGHHQFTDLSGTSAQSDRLWLGVEIGAECRRVHSLEDVWIDGAIGQSDLDGMVDPLDTSGLGDGVGVLEQWPLAVPAPDARTMPVKRMALHVPIDAAFDDGLVSYFDSPEEVFAAGEAEVARRMDDGMTAAEARALPYELHTVVSVSAMVTCQYDIPAPVIEYFQRRDAMIPLTIEYVPVEVAAPAGTRTSPGDDLAARPEVTDAALSVVADPSDPCVVHLSGTIQTNVPMDVDYRFVNPHGQPSNTYTATVDQTGTAFVSRSADVPVLSGPDPDGGFVIDEPAADLGDLSTGDVGDEWTGVFELEVLAPNRVVAVDGFSVPYCPGRVPTVVVGGVGDGRRDTLNATLDPTH